jgi:hypothetical protein
MGSLARLPGSLAAVALAGAALTMPSAAQAMAADPPTFNVPCSTNALVTAINAANSFDSATVRLRPACMYSITTPATTNDGLPVVTGHITLVGGQKSVIRRSSAATTAFRILDVAASATLSVTGVSVLDGSTTGLGGGIQNAGTLRLHQDTLSGNTAGNGGGLANLAGATAVVTRTRITANTTTGVGGGAILNSGKLKVIICRFSGNTAPINGGGLNTQASGKSRIYSSVFVGNVSGGLGGGMSNLGTTLISGSVVRLNKGSAGGGIATSSDHVTLRRTVVQDNIPDNCSPLNTITGCQD